MDSGTDVADFLSAVLLASTPQFLTPSSIAALGVRLLSSAGTTVDCRWDILCTSEPSEACWWMVPASAGASRHHIGHEAPRRSRPGAVVRADCRPPDCSGAAGSRPRPEKALSGDANPYPQCERRDATPAVIPPALRVLYGDGAGRLRRKARGAPPRLSAGVATWLAALGYEVGDTPMMKVVPMPAAAFRVVVHEERVELGFGLCF